MEIQPARRRIRKWIGIGLPVFFAGIGITSGFWAFFLTIDRYFIGVAAGYVELGACDCPVPFGSGIETHKIPWRSWSWNWEWWLEIDSYFAEDGSTYAFCRCIKIPLWMLLLAVTIPTLILWRHDLRRPLEGCCQKCAYNLTGNLSGRCPECGASVIAGETRKVSATDS